MSHNYPFRRQPPPLMSLGARRADLGPYSSADHRHATPDHDFCIQHEEPPARLLSSSFPPSHSSSLSSSREQWSADSGLNILSSCGLEPSDLSVLAELPEDVLTVESLPHVLREIKGKRVTSKPRQPIAPGTPAPFPASLARRPPSPPSDDWDRLRSPVMNLPVDPPGMMSGPLVSERDDRWQDRWENPRCTTSAIYTPSSRADPVVSPPSSSYMVEYNHQVRRPEYGMDKEEDSSSFGYIPGGGQRSLGGRGHSSLFSHSESHDNNPALLLDNYRPKTQQLEASSRKRQSHGGSSQPIGAAKIPSKKQALDFHGTTPEVYPYTCCLCDITVLSEMGWLKHINGANHADGQLTLLQRFPNWDCRMETVTRALEQQKDKEASVQQNTNSQSNKSSKKHSSEKRSVVCIKFPTNSVDEQYLRKLVEPFGELVKIVMFPSVAYVELATSDQAMDMVNFHNKYSTTVGDQKIEFSVSSTFNFIQDLRVLSFTPAPGGPNGQSDLIRIVKRFGPPLYMLFLPSVAFVEMKKAADAQNVVDYYSPTNLRINNKFIKVAFSGEYRTLARVPSAKSCEEETTSAKRTRSLSREKGDKRRRSSSKSSDNKDKQKEDGKSSKEMRSRSKDRSSSSSFKDKDNKKEEEKSNRERTSTSKEKTSSNSSKEKKTVEQASRSKDRSSSSYSKAHDKNTEKKSKDKSSNNSGKEKNNKTDEKSSKERSRSKEKTSSSSAKDDNKKKEEQRSRSKEKTSSTLSKDEDKKKEEQRSRSKEKTNSTLSKDEDKKKEEQRSKLKEKSRNSLSKEEDKKKDEERSRSKERSSSSSSKNLTKNTEEMSKDKSSSSSLKEDKQKEEMCSKERSKPEEKSSKNEDKQKEERSMSREKSSSISSKEEGKKKEDSKSGKERTSGLEDKPSTVSSKDTVEKDRDKLKRESRSGSSDKSSSKSSTENTSGECVMIQKTEKDGSRADKTPPGMQKGSPKDGVVGEDGDAVLAVVEKVQEATAKQKEGKAPAQTDPTQHDQEELTAKQKDPINRKEEEESVRMAGEEQHKPLMKKQEEEQEEPDFPVDLENCITLDELEHEESDDQDSDVENKDQKKKEEGLKRKSDDTEQQTLVKKKNRDDKDVTSEPNEEDLDFPMDLENCITLDELELEQDEQREKASDDKHKGNRVLYLANLPAQFYTDDAFLAFVKRLGKVERYLLLRSRNQGFVEMSSSSEALRVLKEHGNKTLTFKDHELILRMSTHRTLTIGYSVPPDEGLGQTTQSSRKSQRRSKSESNRKSADRRESSKKTSVSRSSQEKDPVDNELPQDQEKEASPKTGPDSTGPEKLTEAETGNTEVSMEQPEGGAEAAPPVGVEFVRPVVGYMCTLCNVIYADEDEAKLQHCCSRAHRHKYQVHSEKKLNL